MGYGTSDSNYWINLIIIIVLVLIFLWLVLPCFTQKKDHFCDMAPMNPPFYPKFGRRRKRSRSRRMKKKYLDNVISGESEPTNMDDYGLVNDQCSSSCCSDQYPLPFRVQDDLQFANKDDFVPNSYTCNNGSQNSGCLCMTKDQAKFLDSRGNNSDC